MYFQAETSVCVCVCVCVCVFRQGYEHVERWGGLNRDTGMCVGGHEENVGSCVWREMRFWSLCV